MNIDRYTLEIHEQIYGPKLIETNTQDGDWVKYEDIESLPIEYIIEQYESLTDKIKSRWEELIGFGCGYFDHWRRGGSDILVTYERPCRQGGGIADTPDRIPIKCFEVSLEEAIKIYNKSLN